MTGPLPPAGPGHSSPTATATSLVANGDRHLTRRQRRPPPHSSPTATATSLVANGDEDVRGDGLGVLQGAEVAEVRVADEAAGGELGDEGRRQLGGAVIG